MQRGFMTDEFYMDRGKCKSTGEYADSVVPPLSVGEIPFV